MYLTRDLSRFAGTGIDRIYLYLPGWQQHLYQVIRAGAIVPSAYLQNTASRALADYGGRLVLANAFIARGLPATLVSVCSIRGVSPCECRSLK